MVKGKGAIAGVVAATAAALAVAAPAHAATRVIAVDGVSKQRADLRVEILVQVKSGQSARAVADNALAAQGAKRAPAPPESAAFTTTGLVWNVLPVVQNYNPAGEPAGVAGQTALMAGYTDWNGVTPSDYVIQSGGTTNRCPSLVKGCRGGSRSDGLNDVGWARLSGSTLGVTYYLVSVDEADMAINTRFTWRTGACTDASNIYNLETVYLHENGHVAGLGHSSDPRAVMYPSYHGPLCTLQADDINGLNRIYG